MSIIEALRMQREANIVEVDDIDFNAYLANTEPKRKIKEKSYYEKEVISYFEGNLINKGNHVPWDVHGYKIGLRPSEISIWAGINGHGKSLMIGQVVLELIKQGQRCLIASFEMKPEITLARMARQAIGKKIPTIQDLEKFNHWKKNHLYLLEHHGMIDIDVILGVCLYASKELGVKHIVIDSLMKCVRGEDDYNGQKDFVNALCGIALSTGLHIHLIHHVRKGNDEKQVSGKFDLKGSGSITDQVDNVFIVWRNKAKALERQQSGITDESVPDALLCCEKQRNGEWEGRIPLWFDDGSQQYVDEMKKNIRNYL
jgi:twinkle protein